MVIQGQKHSGRTHFDPIWRRRYKTTWVFRSICLSIVLSQSFCFYGDRSSADSSPSPTSRPAANDQSPSPSIPPEILRQISELSRTDLQNQSIQNQLTPLHRLELLALGILILLAGIFLCRYLASGYPDLIHANGLFGLLGLFGAVAALCLACSAIGVMVLHLAAAACTVVSGFSIAAFLLPQFNLTKNWITPNSTPGPTTPPEPDLPQIRDSS